MLTHLEQKKRTNAQMYKTNFNK